MQTDADLPTLIRRQDHLNVLRYIRVHQLREPQLVVQHGQALLLNSNGDETALLAAWEQLCLGALDCHQPELAQVCLDKLLALNIPKESLRFQRLVGRCAEAHGDWSTAQSLYTAANKKSTTNLQGLKRLYCIYKGQVGQEAQAMQALNQYLQQAAGDAAAWYEMAQFRQAVLGDYRGACFALEEVVLACPSEAKIHLALAESYATAAADDANDHHNKNALTTLLVARKHVAQALELDPTNRRAMLVLVAIANDYLLAAAEADKKKNNDDYEIQVAQELVRYGAERAIEAYKGCNHIFPAVQNLMKEYTNDL